MCSLNGTSSGENCTSGASGSTVWPAVIIFFLGNALRGVGFSIYYVIAMPFVDDNVPKRNSPIFIAIMQCVILLGPASGYVVFAFFLRLYEDPWSKDDAQAWAPFACWSNPFIIRWSRPLTNGSSLYWRLVAWLSHGWRPHSGRRLAHVHLSRTIQECAHQDEESKEANQREWRYKVGFRPFLCESPDSPFLLR